MNTKIKEGARNKGNPYFLRDPWNKGGLVNTGPEVQGPYSRKVLGLGLKLRLLSQVSAQNLLRLLS